MVHRVSVVVSLISRVITPSVHLSHPSLTPFAREAHPVSYSFLFSVDRKWLEPTDTHTEGSRQEVISLQHLQLGNRTAPAGWWKNRPCTLLHTHIHIYKQVPNPTNTVRLPPQLLALEPQHRKQSKTQHSFSVLEHCDCLLVLHTNRNYLRYQLMQID